MSKVYDTQMSQVRVTIVLRVRQYQAPVVRVIYRILLSRDIELRCAALRFRRLVVNLPVHLCQKRRRSAREPAPAA